MGRNRNSEKMDPNSRSQKHACKKNNNDTPLNGTEENKLQIPTIFDTQLQPIVVGVCHSLWACRGRPQTIPGFIAKNTRFTSLTALISAHYIRQKTEIKNSSKEKFQ